MSGYTRYGYGDEQTFPPCYGHPNDPRTDDFFAEEDNSDEDAGDDDG